jgi:hypothetical protein
MQSTTAERDKDTDTDERIDCDYDWCEGAKGDVLPCFECYDPECSYDLGVEE